MARTPAVDRSAVKKRLELHLRDEDLRVLELLVEEEGGKRNDVARRALLLYCDRIEVVERLFDLTPKPAK